MPWINSPPHIGYSLATPSLFRERKPICSYTLCLIFQFTKIPLRGTIFWDRGVAFLTGNSRGGVANICQGGTQNIEIQSLTHANRIA